MTMMFNPYTGTPRHPSDIASDPEGTLIAEPDAPLRAATLAGLQSALAEHMSKADDGWLQLPQRLRGRGDFHRDRGQVKDAELMYDAASEIEELRSRK